ncbi:PD-(D/E)XK nuclease family protein, partial [Candidatus Uhrbacteria bacterium]|nr:PD-(D/E)XK nuclease family protein [Candidatus Uhrbacteria bacterium]
ASKGLEFRHVFLVGAVDQRFPTRERRDPIPLPDGLVNERLPEGDAHLEEERRLMYVAMTRAKDSLMVTGSEDMGGVRKKKPSVFIAEAELTLETGTVEGGSVLSLAPAEPVREAERDIRDHVSIKRRFSFTQLAAFRSCPLQYKFAHVYRVPILGSYHKSFGQTMHLTLHDVLVLHRDRGLATQVSLFAAPSETTPTEGFRVSVDEATDIYEARWAENDLWYPDRPTYEKYHAEGRSAIRLLCDRWQASPPDVVALEQAFDWKIGDHSIRGSVDRIDRLPDGSVALIDYKTGTPKTHEKLESSDKEQLRIYQLAMTARGLTVGRLVYAYLRDGTDVEIEPLAGEEIETFTSDLQERMDAILSSAFPPNASRFTCTYCDFRGICEYRKL